MPLHTPLGPKNTNTCVQKKSKISRIELSPHKYSVIKRLHKGDCSVKDIMKIKEIPCSMYSTQHPQAFQYQIKRALFISLWTHSYPYYS